MNWLKQNVVIVILSAVIVVSLPVAWFISSGMNNSVRERQQEAAAAAQREISNASVTYTIPAALPGEQPIEVRSAPNRALTEWFASERERVTEDASGVLERALAFNRGEHRPFVAELFPSAGTAQRTQQRMTEFRRLILGDGRTPSMYERLIAQHDGGGTADTGRLYEALQDLIERENERLRAERGSSAAPTEEDREALTRRLSERRLSEYRRRGREISFYMGTDAFFQDQGRGSAYSQQWRSTDVAGGADLFDAFIIQWDFWVFRDILAAIRAANTDSGGQRMPIERSVIKRVDRISVEELPVYGEEPLALRTSEARSEDGLAPVDARHSLTGRVSSAENSVYDVRRAEIVVVASSERLPAFFRALRRVNFMTVLGVNIEPVDAWADLQQGFYYGDEHVVRATISVETVWLRSWTARLMPAELREALGAELPAEDEDGMG
ncbi:MAG: hypothetical protein EA378_10075 [Phycisphaerales bacterium]|nr:MAG: hypothetical protein EA378_10075 [Phycisphaerales bacterium]